METHVPVSVETKSFKASSRFWIREFPLLLVGIVLLIFLVFYRFGSYPALWFDPGSHLHVAKALVKYGVYADYSSEGFRYYGPSVGVGPTVIFPVALAFHMFGIGVWQSQLPMVIYLLAAVAVFAWLAVYLGRELTVGAIARYTASRFAWAASLLLISSRSVLLINNGRQVLGEVPGLFFLIVGLLILFNTWDKPDWGKLALAGLFFGLAMITKSQYFLVLFPALVLSWLANQLYYRLIPQQVLIFPTIIALAVYAAWQVILLRYLGPSSFADNLALLRESVAGAAFLFSPLLMERSFREVIGPNAYLGLMLPALAYGAFLTFPKKRDAQQWNILLCIILVNLTWYILASISWERYVFPAAALSSLFVARFFGDLTGGFHPDIKNLRQEIQRGLGSMSAIRLVMFAWLIVTIVVSLGMTVKEVITPAANTAQQMADYISSKIPQNTIIETWEPEMGFLTDHRYHYPPQELLNQANAYIWMGKQSPGDLYFNTWTTARPQYVLIGEFAAWVNLYDYDYLQAHYDLLQSYGAYQLWVLKQ